MTLSTAAKNAMLDQLSTLITHLGLSNAGAELSGGAPAYARQAVAFGAAVGGVPTMTGSRIVGALCSWSSRSSSSPQGDPTEVAWALSPWQPRHLRSADAFRSSAFVRSVTAGC